MGQLSFWSADARPRALGDLEGLLCGPGRAELFGRGSAARIIVVLGPPPMVEVDEDADEDEEPDGPEVDPEPAPEPEPAVDVDTPVDPDELAFLDLDPDEIAARLGVRSEPRGGGSADVGRRRRRRAGNADPEDGHVPGVAGEGERQRRRIARTALCAPEDDPVTAWRARAVCCALRARGAPAEIGRAEDGRAEVRTAFRTDLADLARAWTGGGGMKAAPGGFELDGPRLRLWVLASGAHDGRAYTLGLDPEVRTLDDRLLTASRHLGLGARLADDAAVPSLRIIGTRRQGRLGELVGRPPRETADGVWPV